MGRRTRRIVILACLLAGCPSTYGEDTPAPNTVDGSADAPSNLPSGDGGGGGAADADSGSRPCIEGDRQAIDPDTGRCYMFFGRVRTWPQGGLACRDIGANLASIATPAENALVVSILTAGAWVGASDAIQDGNYIWESGEAFEFTNWADREPAGRFRADCVEVQTDGKWRAEPCTSLRPYVCERN